MNSLLVSTKEFCRFSIIIRWCRSESLLLQSILDLCLDSLILFLDGFHFLLMRLVFRVEFVGLASLCGFDLLGKFGNRAVEFSALPFKGADFSLLG